MTTIASTTPARIRPATAAAWDDQQTWDVFVRRHDRTLHAIARSYRLGDADAQDAVQTAWLRFVEHRDRLRTAEAASGWLCVTTRHECLRLLRRRGREVPTDAAELPHVAPAEDPEDPMVELERRRLVWRAVSALSDRQRLLVEHLMQEPGLRYDEIAARLGMPIGSIGPTRARCLQHLRRELQLVA